MKSNIPESSIRNSIDISSQLNDVSTDLADAVPVPANHLRHTQCSDGDEGSPEREV